MQEIDEAAAIRNVIQTMQAAWNRGDFHGYMDGFARPDVIFVSRGRIQKDWEATLEHYIADYGGAPGSQGQLTFSNIRVEMLAADAAQLVSNYALVRSAGSQTGVNTRLMRKREGRWLIALNHVSHIEP
jgi:uncharacterized protein (TIGR02246 family)